eukprot:5593756-Pyramimonas_sp.AAC.2
MRGPTALTCAFRLGPLQAPRPGPGPDPALDSARQRQAPREAWAAAAAAAKATPKALTVASFEDSSDIALTSARANAWRGPRLEREGCRLWQPPLKIG